MEIVASDGMRKYFSYLDENIKKAYNTASKARTKGYDPSKEVEIPVARNMGERVEGLVSESIKRVDEVREVSAPQASQVGGQVGEVEDEDVVERIGDDEEIEAGRSSKQDEFGEDFEVPAFLRKIH